MTKLHNPRQKGVSNRGLQWLTFHHQFSCARVLPDLDTIGALILDSHLLDHQLQRAAIIENLHPARWNHLLPILVPGGGTASGRNCAFQNDPMFLQGRSIA